MDKSHLFPRHEDTLIARFKKIEDGDGQSVDVYCCAMPARFYKLVVKSEPNSIGTPQKGFEITTGTVEHEFVVSLAKEIADGMIGFYPKEPQ